MTSLRNLHAQPEAAATATFPEAQSSDHGNEPTRHVNLISLGPNHVHQVDFSLAINWKIKDGTAVYDELVYKNKLPAAGQPRLLRMIVTDHCSGMLFVWYTAAPGETTAALIEGLWHAWTEKRIGDRPITPIYPFRGVPRILMIDRGPGTRTQVFENFLAWLEVELNICEGSRSKGQVENAHWWWEQKFEGRFRLDPVVSVDRLNEDALQFAASLCKTKIHERTKATRTAHWEFYLNRNFESVLRVPNCSFEEAKRYAVSNDKSCRVYGDGTIQFKGNRYRLPESLLREKAVNVVYSPYDYPAVIVRALAPGSVPVAVRPLARNEHGFFVDGAVIGKEFKSHKYDQRQRLQAEAQQRIEEWTASSERMVTRGYHLEGLETSGIQSAETPIEANVQPAAMPAHQAREEVLFRVGRDLTAPERALLLGFGETVTEAEIAAVVEQIVNGVLARVIPMRAAAE